MATPGYMPVSDDLHAAPPRSECTKHGVKEIKPPWAKPSSRFTALFEALAIEWLKAASQKAVAGLLKLSWGTRYDWLRNPAAMEPDDRKEFAELRNSELKTARAWALKETAMTLYSYVYERLRGSTFVGGTTGR